MIYLDSSATTPLAPEVLEAMLPFFHGEFGNPSSVYTLGSRAKVALEQARETVARSIGALPKEITFTSGGTEANNTALTGPLMFRAARGVPWNNLSLITSRAEHHAVLHTAEFLAKLGTTVSFADVSNTGHVDLDHLRSLLSPDTTLVSLMSVNNEVGAINPISTIAEHIRTASRALIHTDAVQAPGKIPIDVRTMNVDLLTLSAHKIFGPKGIGALYTRSGVEWEPLIHGGAQERNRRGGTESVALAVGFARAIELLPKSTELLLKSTEHLSELRQYLLAQLASIPEVVLNSATDDTSVASIVNFSFTPEVLQTLEEDTLIIRFDLSGIAISNGSACTSGSQQPSHVLLAMAKGEETARKSVRVSMTGKTTRQELDEFVRVLHSIIPRS